MMAIRKRGDAWQADCYVNGRRLRETFPDKKLATLWVQKQKLAEAQGEVGIRPTQRIGFRDLVALFLKHVEDHKAAGTLEYYSIHCRAHLVPYFLDRPVHQLTRADAESYLAKRRGEVHARTANKELTTLRTVLSFAIKHGYLKTNPAAGVAKLRSSKKREIRFLSAQEIDRFLAECPSSLYPVFLVSFDTGVRKSELFNLRHEDVDLDRGLLRVQSRGDFETKNYKSRTVPLTDRLVRCLRGLGGGDGLLFPSARAGGGAFSDLRASLAVIAERAGVASFTPHDCRHSYASALVREGLDLRSVQELLGHQSLASTLIYAHLAPDHLERARAILEARAGGRRRLRIVKGGAKAR